MDVQRPVSYTQHKEATMLYQQLETKILEIAKETICRMYAKRKIIKRLAVLSGMRRFTVTPPHKRAARVLKRLLCELPDALQQLEEMETDVILPLSISFLLFIVVLHLGRRWMDVEATVDQRFGK